MYTIDRIEKVPNREGIEEIFVAVTITDDLGSYPMARWMLVQEKADYDNEVKTIDEIINVYLLFARDAKLAEIKASELEKQQEM